MKGYGGAIQLPTGPFRGNKSFGNAGSEHNPLYNRLRRVVSLDNLMDVPRHSSHSETHRRDGPNDSEWFLTLIDWVYMESPYKFAGKLAAATTQTNTLERPAATNNLDQIGF